MWFKKSIEPEDTIACFGSNLVRASILKVLPLPDSPTIPKLPFLSNFRLKLLNVFTKWFPGKAMLKFLISKKLFIVLLFFSIYILF